MKFASSDGTLVCKNKGYCMGRGPDVSMVEAVKDDQGGDLVWEGDNGVDDGIEVFLHLPSHPGQLNNVLLYSTPVQSQLNNETWVLLVVTVKNISQLAINKLACSQHNSHAAMYWTHTLTWTLISAVESDTEIRDALFPGVGAIRRSDGKPKTHYQCLLAVACFADHPTYKEAFAIDPDEKTPVLAKHRELWAEKIMNEIKTPQTGDFGIASEAEILLGTALTTKWVTRLKTFLRANLLRIHLSITGGGPGHSFCGKTCSESTWISPGRGPGHNEGFAEVELKYSRVFTLQLNWSRVWEYHPFENLNRKAGRGRLPDASFDKEIIKSVAQTYFSTMATTWRKLSSEEKASYNCRK
ncbi:hypothetical protein B0H13DRAFT_1853200 [Mycena leptocephala]|nr:hypothetical protein B0H13DRAFT_1853200 [Mycena leptocephala]